VIARATPDERNTVSAAMPPAAGPPTRSAERVGGLDLARAVAILGMVVINFKESFVDMEAAAAGLLAWLSVLPSGRASTLFVTLAGTGIMLMGRGAETGAAARVLLKRSLFLLVAGNLLFFIWDGDILHFYAVYLFFSAIIFIRLPRAALLPLAALAALAGPLLHLLFGSIDPAAIEYHSAHGMFIDIVGWGLHPIFPWFTFILTGFWIGHLDLRDRGTRRTLALGGALLACGAPLADLAIGHLAAFGLLPGRALSLLGTLWSPGLLFTLGRVGSAVFIIAVGQSIAGRLPGSIVVRSLVATGQLSFTIYIFHVVVWVHLFSRVTGVEQFGLARLFLHVASFYLFIVPAGAIYRRFCRRGPIEWFMRLLCGETPPRTVAPPPAVRLARAPAWAWLPVLPALPAILVIQLAGTPLGWIAESAPLAEGRRYAEITVFSDEATWTLELNEESEIVIETFSDRDLYLEILDEEGETIAESDDDGVAYNGRILGNVDPGRYRVVVTSLDKIPGAFVLETRIGPA
jgi:uncharacterized membrane protein YeiB